MRRDAFAAESDRHGVRIRIGAAHLALSGRLVHVDVFDDLSLFVVEAAQERARTEQAAEAAVRECGKRVG